MRMALVPHVERNDALDVGRKIAAGGRARGIEVAADSVAAQALEIDAAPFEDLDVVVAVGGDGTMLSAVQVALREDVPVLGVNLGTVGFLADAEVSDLDMVLDRLASGSWTVAERMTLQTTAGANKALGVNDVVVEKVDSQRLVALSVAFDGEPFLTYRADGLVFGTPTGSTAYNFSAGGPLVDPGLEAIVLTPVAPFSLFTRSVVLEASVVVQCTVAQDRHVRVSADGVPVAELSPGDVVEIRRGERPVRFVQMTGRSFPARVKTKFRLGGL
ncbi:MAG TPA: NAD(+)/NADH kinase [Acidimicrobiia bacterium]|jgi:NAD+ kinase|nr:NAD(+)/NADH kinase [Acidimicrobiia bacterium]